MPLKIIKEELIQKAQPGVYILRGLPGSGKSTFVKDLKEACNSGKHTIYRTNSVSAYDYWINWKGEYIFKPEKVPENHFMCLRRFVRGIYLMADCGTHCQTDALLVDNTNTSIPELETYAKIALAFYFNVSIVTFNCSVARSLERNVHNVPTKVIEGMFEKLCYANAKLDDYCLKNKITNYEVD